VTWRIVVTPTAMAMFRAIADRRVREKLAAAIDRLTVDPDRQGKPLTADLSGLRSLRAVGQRYRILYRIEGEQVVVCVVAVGLRREGARDDIYALARKLLRQGLLEGTE